MRLRVGMDTGKIRYSADLGQIVSETINYAAHLEKGAFEGRKAWRILG